MKMEGIRSLEKVSVGGRLSTPDRLDSSTRGETFDDPV